MRERRVNSQLELEPEDIARVRALLEAGTGSPLVLAHGALKWPDALPGQLKTLLLVALDHAERRLFGGIDEPLQVKNLIAAYGSAQSTFYKHAGALTIAAQDFAQVEVGMFQLLGAFRSETVLRAMTVTSKTGADAHGPGIRQERQGRLVQQVQDFVGIGLAGEDITVPTLLRPPPADLSDPSELAGALGRDVRRTFDVWDRVADVGARGMSQACRSAIQMISAFADPDGRRVDPEDPTRNFAPSCLRDSVPSAVLIPGLRLVQDPTGSYMTPVLPPIAELMVPLDGLARAPLLIVEDDWGCDASFTTLPEAPTRKALAEAYENDRLGIAAPYDTEYAVSRDRRTIRRMQFGDTDEPGRELALTFSSPLSGREATIRRLSLVEMFATNRCFNVCPNRFGTDFAPADVQAKDAGRQLIVALFVAINIAAVAFARQRQADSLRRA